MTNFFLGMLTAATFISYSVGLYYRDSQYITFTTLGIVIIAIISAVRYFE